MLPSGACAHLLMFRKCPKSTWAGLCERVSIFGECGEHWEDDAGGFKISHEGSAGVLFFVCMVVLSFGDYNDYRPWAGSQSKSRAASDSHHIGIPPSIYETGSESKKVFVLL